MVDVQEMGVEFAQKDGFLPIGFLSLWPVWEHALSVCSVSFEGQGGKLHLSKRGNGRGAELGCAEMLSEQIPPLLLFPQCWDRSNRCVGHHGNSHVPDREEPARLPTGYCSENARPARHDGADISE